MSLGYATGQVTPFGVARAENFTLRLRRHTKIATRVTFSDGGLVEFMDRMPAYQAIPQAVEQRQRHPEYDWKGKGTKAGHASGYAAGGKAIYDVPRYGALELHPRGHEWYAYRVAPGAFHHLVEIGEVHPGGHALFRDDASPADRRALALVAKHVAHNGLAAGQFQVFWEKTKASAKKHWATAKVKAREVGSNLHEKSKVAAKRGWEKARAFALSGAEIGGVPRNEPVSERRLRAEENASNMPKPDSLHGPGWYVILYNYPRGHADRRAKSYHGRFHRKVDAMPWFRAERADKVWFVELRKLPSDPFAMEDDRRAKRAAAKKRAKKAASKRPAKRTARPRKRAA